MADSKITMPIKAEPYAHQEAAFGFACDQFGIQGGDASLSVRSQGIALLMEM